MFNGNYAQFSQNLEQRELLFSTRGTTLVEASPYDCVWGIGLAADDPRAQDRSQWLGLNLLGRRSHECGKHCYVRGPEPSPAGPNSPLRRPTPATENGGLGAYRLLD